MQCSLKLLFDDTTRPNMDISNLLYPDANRPSALIVTTIWSSVDPKLGDICERGLTTVDNLFKPDLDNGAQFVRHDGTQESARAMLGVLIGVRTQRELVGEVKELPDWKRLSEWTNVVRWNVEGHTCSPLHSHPYQCRCRSCAGYSVQCPS